jgi:hypothetical protein
MRLHRTLALLLLLPLLLSGCGKSAKVVPVSGQVTLDKKPLANADVTFSPADADAKNPGALDSSGRTDEQGRFSLKMIQDKREGAVVGSHKVRISLIERGTTIVNRVPKEYNTESKLTFTVPAEGTTDANFELKSQGN